MSEGETALTPAESATGTVSTVSLYDTTWGECLQIIVEADIEEIEPPWDTWNPDGHVTMPGDGKVAAFT